jgi:hypothetical protein
MAHIAEEVPPGLLLSYGQDFPDFFRRAAFGNFKDQVTRTASRQAAQKTRKKQARNTGKLAAFDQISTVRPMK